MKNKIVKILLVTILWNISEQKSVYGAIHWFHTCMM